MKPETAPLLDHREIEANRFAMALLMPEFMLRPDVEKLQHAPTDEDIKSLAQRYEVEPCVLLARLFQLKLVRSI